MLVSEGDSLSLRSNQNSVGLWRRWNIARGLDMMSAVVSDSVSDKLLPIVCVKAKCLSTLNVINSKQSRGSHLSYRLPAGSSAGGGAY